MGAEALGENGDVGVGWEGAGRDQKETQYPGEESERIGG